MMSHLSKPKIDGPPLGIGRGKNPKTRGGRPGTNVTFLVLRLQTLKPETQQMWPWLRTRRPGREGRPVKRRASPDHRGSLQARAHSKTITSFICCIFSQMKLPAEPSMAGHEVSSVFIVLKWNWPEITIKLHWYGLGGGAHRDLGKWLCHTNYVRSCSHGSCSFQTERCVFTAAERCQGASWTSLLVPTGRVLLDPMLLSPRKLKHSQIVCSFK